MLQCDRDLLTYHGEEATYRRHYSDEGQGGSAQDEGGIALLVAVALLLEGHRDEDRYYGEGYMQWSR